MTEEFISGTRPPDAGFATQLVQPPGALYISPEESLILGLLSETVGQTVVFNIRLLLADGTVQYLSQSLTTAGGGVFGMTAFPLAEGFLLSVQAYHAGSFTTHGQCYVYVGISRGQADGLNHIQTILADHITTSWFPTWPQMQPTPPDAGVGQMIVLAGTTPAAGAQFTFAPTIGRRFRIVGATMILTTSATVANRFFRLAVNSGGDPVIICYDATAITASQAMVLIIGPPAIATIAGSVHVLPVAPDVIIGPDSTLATSITNLAAGDQLSNIVFFVERWF